jgi:hypothetical protein
MPIDYNLAYCIVDLAVLKQKRNLQILNGTSKKSDFWGRCEKRQIRLATVATEELLVRDAERGMKKMQDRLGEAENALLAAFSERRGQARNDQ